MAAPTDDELSRDLQSLRIDRGPPEGSGAPRQRDSSDSSWPKWLVAVGAVALVGYGIVRFVVPRAESAVFKTEVSLTEISSISPAQASVEVTSTGYLTPQIVAKVGSKVVERVTKVYVREGAHVKAGAILFELDPSEKKSAIASASARVAAASARAQAARASIAEVELQWNRQKTLAAAGAAPSATADDLAARMTALREQARAQEADVGAAQAEVAAQSIGLRFTTIVAPISGVAVTKPVEVGDVVNAGQVLIELADFDSLVVETDVPEGRLAKIRAGGPTEIVLDADPATRFRGVVVEVGPRINRSKATATVKVRFVEPPKTLRPEMAARVSFLSKELGESELKQAEKVLVPREAIADRSGQKVVWVVEGGKLRAAPLRLGETIGSSVVILEGPPPGTRVVRAPVPTLAEGQSVKERAK